MIEIAPASSPEDSPKPYTITKFTNQEIEVRIDDRHYQLTGVNLKQLNNFSMTIRLCSGNEPPFIDTVNLTRSKSRFDFVMQAKDHLNLSEEILKTDLYILMSAVEKLQRDNIARLEQEKIQYRKRYEMSATEEAKALDLLRSRDIIKEVLLPDMERIGYVGDELGKQILFLAGTSRLLDHPISVLSVANSSAGKSFSQDTILSLFPDDEKIGLTRMTPRSLSHFSKYEICNMILCVDEFTGIEPESMSQIRSMLSKGFISLAYTSIDRLTGKMETLQKEVYGPIAIFTSTTHEELIDDETRNRFIILPADESINQTLRVMKSLVYQNTKKGIIARRERLIIERKFKAIQKCLEPAVVALPDEFSKSIQFNTERLSYKRKFDGYLSLIKSIALTRQFQRQSDTIKGPNGDSKLIYITKDDILYANDLVTELFGQTLGELNPVDEQCLRDCQSYCEKKAAETGVQYHKITFTQRDIREYANWEHTPLKRSLNRLRELEYILLVFGGDRSRHYYKINTAASADGIKLRLWTPKPPKSPSTDQNEGSKTGSKTETGSPENQTGSGAGDPVSTIPDNEKALKYGQFSLTA